MKTVQANCRVLLRFEDGETTYTVMNPPLSGTNLGVISTASPIGKEIIGKKEGEEIILNNHGLRIWCRIEKVYNPVYNAR